MIDKVVAHSNDALSRLFDKLDTKLSAGPTRRGSSGPPPS